MKVNYIVLTVLIGTLFFFGSFDVHARLHSNSSESAFAEGGDEEAKLPCLSIGEMIIKGAEYFFKAHGDINLLSEKVEISDINGADFYVLGEAVDSALENMKTARSYYRELQYKANSTPSNQAVIDKLLAFDYDSFQVQNSLVKDVFCEVKGYLVNGDVCGVYNHTSSYFDTLIRTLETIKEELGAGKIPANDHMWNLNQVCAISHLFGQYVARVFAAIK